MENFFVKSLGSVPVRKSDVVEKDAEASLKAWEKRERAPFKQLLDVDSAKAKMDEATRLSSSASEAIALAEKTDNRDDAVSHLLDANKLIVSAREIAGRSGSDAARQKFVMAENEVTNHIDALYKQKRNRLAEDPAAKELHRIVTTQLQSRLRTANDYLKSHQEMYKTHYQKDGKGAIPGFRALADGESSRTHTFVGGIETRIHRDEIRRHLHRVGYGRVDQVVSGNVEHELWEAVDGKSVRVSYSNDGAGKRTITVKERPKDRWRASRDEFKNSYYGNAHLLAGNPKPGVPPVGANVGRESELPFMPIDRPKGKKAGV